MLQKLHGHYLNLNLATYKLCSKITFLSLSFTIFRIGIIPALRVDVKIHAYHLAYIRYSVM